MMSAGFGFRSLSRMAVAVAIVCGVAGGTSGCSIIGGTGLSQEEATQMNLANQRKVALIFWRGYANPALTAIRFTDEGNKPGLGAPWSANAVVTVNGNDYNEILGKEVWGGDPLPTPPPGSTTGAVTITYSNGAQELVQ